MASQLSEKQGEFLESATRSGVKPEDFKGIIPEIRDVSEKPDSNKPTIAYIHTGGTLMMVPSAESNALSFQGATDINKALDVCDLVAQVRKRYNIIGIYLDSIDSIEVGTEFWSAMAATIKSIYTRVEGVVIGHGTHTAEYSAAAIAFALRNPSKPIIFTASQIPLLGFPGSDAMANLTGAMEIAANSTLAEVAVYANGIIHRGARVRKVNDSRLAVFDSPITGPIGYFGAGGIELAPGTRRRADKRDYELIYLPNFSTTVSNFKFIPGMSDKQLTASSMELVNAGDVGIILETPGSGAIPARFVPILAEHARRGFPVFLTSAATQSGISTGMTLHDDAAIVAHKAGVRTAGDMTTGAAAVKLMSILGNNPTFTLSEITREMIERSYAGEISLQKRSEDY